MQQPVLRRRQKLTIGLLGISFLLVISIFIAGYIVVFVMPHRELVVKVDGVARKTAEKFVEAIPAFLEFVQAAKLENKLTAEKASKEEQDTSHPLYGKKIVFTGGKDKALIEELKEVGAEVASSVSKNTFVVIAKSQDEDTGKADAARKLDIPIMTVAEFREKYM